MNSYEIVFTCKNQVVVFKQVVQADTVEQAEAELRKLVKQAGLKLAQVVAVIQL